MESYKEKVSHYIEYPKIKFGELVKRSKNTPPAFISKRGSIYPDTNEYSEDCTEKVDESS